MLEYVIFIINAYWKGIDWVGMMFLSVRGLQHFVGYVPKYVHYTSLH